MQYPAILPSHPSNNIYIYVKVYGLVGEKEVTVVYIMRLIRNHDLAGVGQTPWSYMGYGFGLEFQHYDVCHSLTAGRYININSDTT